MTCIFDVVGEFSERFYTGRNPRQIPRHRELIQSEELTVQEQYLLDEFEYGSVIGCGGARVVLQPVCSCHSNSVVKIARGGIPSSIYDGREQNDYESFLYREATERYGESIRLLPVLSSDTDNYWLEMPYAKPVTELDISLEERRDIRDEVMDSVSVVLMNVMIGEVNSSNIGLYKGNFYLLDYGGDPEVAGSL